MALPRVDVSSCGRGPRSADVDTGSPCCSESSQREHCLLQDLRHAFRSLLRTPGPTAVVVFTLAVGIGVNTSLFSVLNAVLLRPLEYPEPDRIMTLWESNDSLGIEQNNVGAGTFLDWQEGVEAFDSLAAYRLVGHLLTDLETPVQLMTARVSPELFEVLGSVPLHGRPFGEGDQGEEAERRILLSHRLWTRHFGSDPDIVGGTVRLDEEPYEVVGVMVEGFEFPPDAADVEAWTPLNIDPRLVNVRGMRVYGVVGRLSQAASAERARDELAAISAQIASAYPDTNRGWGARVISAHEQLTGAVASTLWILVGAAALVLMIACVNVASVMLARTVETQRELAVRAALGAEGWPLARRSLADGLVLGAVGGSAGLALAAASMGALRSIIPADVPRLQGVGLDPMVLAFSICASVGAGLAVGLLPALRSRRPDLVAVLQDRVRGGTGGAGARRLLDGMVAIEVALAVVLLVGAGLLIRSYRNLIDVDPGFRIDGGISVAMSLPETLYPESASLRGFFNELVDRAAVLPGVEGAGAVTSLPMSPVGMDFDLPFQIEGDPVLAQTDRPRADYRSVIPGYFEALGIPLVRGRLLDDTDREEGRPVMVINESMARTHFSGDPIGRTLGVPMAGSIEIVGIVGDVRHRGLASEPRPEMFVSYQQFSLRDMHLVVRTEEDPSRVIAGVRDIIRELDPRLPVRVAAPLEQIVGESLARPRFNMFLLGAMAASALLLAAAGIYGVISYTVAQRVQEIGIRMALGADAAGTMRMVVSQAMARVGAGAVLGAITALLGGRVLAGLVYGVDPRDPLTLVTVILVLGAVGALAAALPTRRAARIDPVSALRRD